MALASDQLATLPGDGHRQGQVKAVAAGAIGNTMEWYDFAVYGFHAPILAPLFFPSDDHFSSLLAVYGAFAAGYLARPLGALFFGHIGDRYGRRLVLIITVTLMGVCSLAIGLLPTNAAIGPVAGTLLVVLRVLQGFSVGGEYTGSAVYIAEMAPIERRGFLTSFTVAGATAGFLIGSGVTTVLTNLYSNEAMANGLWRVPFLLGFGILVLSVLLRSSMSDAPAAGTEAQKHGTSPVITTFREHWADVLRVCGLVMATGVTFYILFVYAVSYLTDLMHVSTAQAMDINTFALFVLMVTMPIAAILSDRIGRKPVALFGTFALIVGTYPLFSLMHSTDPTKILIGQVGITFLYSFYAGLLPVLISEVAKASVRVCVTSIGYNIVLAVFGGTAPLVATYLVKRTGDDFFPAYYIMAAAAVSFVTILRVKETHRTSLHHPQSD